MSCITPSWFNDDAHSGGIVGVLLGIVFITIGSCILWVKENGQPVPTWRSLTGIIIIILGIMALVVAIIFAAQD